MGHFGIAKGVDRLKLDLRSFTSDYTAGNNCEPIGQHCHVPYFTERESAMLWTLYLSGKLEFGLRYLSDKKWFLHGELAIWFYREAIQAFFEQKKYESYEEELK